jgi:hypothetical protein
MPRLGTPAAADDLPADLLPSAASPSASSIDGAVAHRVRGDHGISRRYQTEFIHDTVVAEGLGDVDPVKTFGKKLWSKSRHKAARVICGGAQAPGPGFDWTGTERSWIYVRKTARYQRLVPPLLRRFIRRHADLVVGGEDHLSILTSQQAVALAGSERERALRDCREKGSCPNPVPWCFPVFRP